MSADAGREVQRLVLENVAGSNLRFKRKSDGEKNVLYFIYVYVYYFIYISIAPLVPAQISNFFEATRLENCHSFSHKIPEFLCLQSLGCWARMLPSTAPSFSWKTFANFHWRWISLIAYVFPKQILFMRFSARTNYETSRINVDILPFSLSWPFIKAVCTQPSNEIFLSGFWDEGIHINLRWSGDRPRRFPSRLAGFIVWNAPANCT